jgi:hypothetical protein
VTSVTVQLGVATPSGGRAAHNRQYQGIWISATPVIISLQERLWIKRNMPEFKGMEQDFILLRQAFPFTAADPIVKQQIHLQL